MDIRAAEISKVIRDQIASFGTETQVLIRPDKNIKPSIDKSVNSFNLTTRSDCL